MDLNLTDSSLKKKYIYADRQILAQHDGDNEDDIYFYLHDRLGSVRLVIGDSGDVVNYYTYEPFGQVIDSSDGPPVTSDGFLFTGQYFDAEIEEYYLRARQYNPQIARFTARDPVKGRFREPLTLDKCLYCGNDPINWADPSGETALNIANALIVVTEMYAAGPRK
ncbi:MAG: RHS repeat-associated core domain-containing protein [Phycisphaerae bacterium]|nr:RHS repeat-associated core domain-containing protein [Phycisphaerae bacterium]